LAGYSTHLDISRLRDYGCHLIPNHGSLYALAHIAIPPLVLVAYQTTATAIEVIIVVYIYANAATAGVAAYAVDAG